MRVRQCGSGTLFAGAADELDAVEAGGATGPEGREALLDEAARRTRHHRRRVPLGVRLARLRALHVVEDAVTRHEEGVALERADCNRGSGVRRGRGGGRSGTGQLQQGE